MTDPLSLFHEAIHQDPVQLVFLDSGGERVEFSGLSGMKLPEYMLFDGCLCHKLDSQTTLSSSSGTQYSLGVILVFYMKRNMTHTEYLQECRRNGWPHISLVDRRRVLDVLENGVAPQAVSSPMPVALKDLNVGSGPRDTVLVKPSEKPSFLPSAPFCSAKSYAPVVSMLRSFFKPQTHAAGPSLLPSGNVNLNPRSLLDQIKQPKTLNLDAIPIIIVPFSSSSLINIFNAKSLLQEERFVPPNQARSLVSGKKPQNVVVRHNSNSFLLIDTIPTNW